MEFIVLLDSLTKLIVLIFLSVIVLCICFKKRKVIFRNVKAAFQNLEVAFRNLCQEICEKKIFKTLALVELVSSLVLILIITLKNLALIEIFVTVLGLVTIVCCIWSRILALIAIWKK